MVNSMDHLLGPGKSSFKDRLILNFVSLPLVKKVVSFLQLINKIKPRKVPAPFTEEKQYVTVPHTENVRMCGKCNGRGRNRCWSCHGKGYKRGSEGKNRTYVIR